MDYFGWEDRWTFRIAGLSSAGSFVATLVLYVKIVEATTSTDFTVAVVLASIVAVLTYIGIRNAGLKHDRRRRRGRDERRSDPGA